MEIKNKKLLTASSIINICLGAFLIICGILEFIGLLPTRADNAIETLGIQLSYFVFASGILVFICGAYSFSERHHYSHINIQIFLGLVSLALPIFVSVILLLQAVICIRLLPTTLSSLFYIISILTVKLSNEALRKSHKLTSSQLSIGEKRKQNVDVTSVFKGNHHGRAKSTNINSLGNLATISKKRSNHMARFNKLISFKGHSRSHTNNLKRLFLKTARRNHMRLPRRR